MEPLALVAPVRVRRGLTQTVVFRTEWINSGERGPDAHVCHLDWTASRDQLLNTAAMEAIRSALPDSQWEEAARASPLLQSAAGCAVSLHDAVARLIRAALALPVRDGGVVDGLECLQQIPASCLTRVGDVVAWAGLALSVARQAEGGGSDLADHYAAIQREVLSLTRR